MRRLKNKPCTLVTERGEQKFDSIAEKNFYLKLTEIKGCKVFRLCELNLPGRVRRWKCDFGLSAKTTEDSIKITKLALTLNGSLEQHWQKYLESELRWFDTIYLEFKGQTDLSTGLTLVDSNFKSRIDWLARYADHILDKTIVVGSGTGGIISYCADGSFRVTPIHSKEYFLNIVRNIW